MTKPKALYILRDRDLIYSPTQQRELAHLLDILGPPERAETIRQNPSLLREVEVVLSGWGAPRFDEAFLNLCPNLSAFFYGAGSVRGFVTDAFWKREIILSSAYAANAIPVTEYALSTIFLSLKRFWSFQRDVRKNASYPPREERTTVAGAYRSTVGIVSLGMIGRLLCEKLRPFDLNIVAYDPFVNRESSEELGVTLISLAELFTQSDVVSVHTPWLPETVGLITGDLLRSMKPNATFINTSRGAVVREDELIDSLKARPDLWAVLDVTWPEPPEPGSPLYTLPNIVLTPHIAGSMAKECWRMGQYMLEELKRYLAGEPLKWQITQEQSRRLA